MAHYPGYVDYKHIRLSAFNDSRLDRLQEKVTKQYGLAKQAHKDAERRVLLSANADTSTVEALGDRVKCLRLLKDAIDAKSFLEASDIPTDGQAQADRHKAELDAALEQLRLAEAVGLDETDADLGPVLKARRSKVDAAKRRYDASSTMAMYDAILNRQEMAARALVNAAQRLTDLVADGSRDEAAIAVAEASTKTGAAHWRRALAASNEACSLVESSFEAASSARDSTMASSFEVVGRPASASTTASASFIRVTGSPSPLFEPEVAGSSNVASSHSLAAAARPSSSASGFGSRAVHMASRPSTLASMAAARPYSAASMVTARASTSATGFDTRALPEAPASRSGFSNFFDFTPVAMSTPLPGIDETGPIGDVPSRVGGGEFGYEPAPASASSANAAANQAAPSAVDVAPSFRPVASRYQDMPLGEARRTVKLKRGELPSRTLWVGRLRKEVGPPQLRQFIQGLGYDRIEKVRTGFGDSPYGDGKTHYYGWVTFADLDKAEDCRYRWDGRSDWDLTPKDERRGGRRLLHMSFCNNTKYADDLLGDHGSGGEVD